MKRIGLWVVGAALLLSSCDTYTGQGAAVGGTFGSILGSAIGGIAGGWRGSDIGTIVGMAGGAAVGAAIGAQADKAEAEKYAAYKRDRERRRADRENQYGDDYEPRGNYDNSGFDGTNSGDDRIDIGISGPEGQQPKEFHVTPSNVAPIASKDAPERVVIRNARFIDQNQDGVLKAGEECRVTFEIMNYTHHTLYDVQPMVYDVTGNKNIHISPNILVESIAPNSGVRYTATILAGKKLKDGSVKIRVGAAVANHELTAQEKEFTIVTRRK